ncbi:MAG: glycosyltransferase family 4 protein [Lachnospiraceae bacterium]|nr:glycosyltransferase family 4 protein [Lachnospiraceae bacterium]
MNVYYDYQILLVQKYGGISRYFYEIIKRLQQTDGINADIHGVHSVNYYFRERLHMFPEMKGRKWTLYNKLNQLKTGFELNGKVDIFHPTYYDPYFLKYKKGKTVVTVYDMIHELYHDDYPEHLGQTDIIRKKELLYASDHVIAISESTKKDIIKIYPDIPEDKITVIYLASEWGKEDRAESFDLPKDYILFVGQRKDYKNFIIFMKAMKEILGKHKDLYLLCLGGGSFSDDEKKLTEPYNDRVIQKDISDTVLKQAYKNALCFVFPSMYEGFGIPTLEAFNCGCPVILSNTSSMPEVGGDAAEYIDPLDAGCIAEKIEKVISDSDLRYDMKQRGYKQSALFSWDKTAEDTLNCYRKVLGGTK